MATNFLNLYAVEAGKVARVFKEKDTTVTDLIQSEEDKKYLHKIFDRGYERDPDTGTHPDGGRYVVAFHELCKKLATKSLSIECSVDDEQTTEIWNLIWSAWEPEDFMELPMSAEGLPAVTYKGASVLQKYVDSLKTIEAAGGYSSDFLDKEDLKNVIDFLQSAILAGLDVFVFISE